MRFNSVLILPAATPFELDCTNFTIAGTLEPEDSFRVEIAWVIRSVKLDWDI